MTIKSELKAYLQGAEKNTINLRYDLKNVCENAAYSPEGKKQKCNDILEKHYKYIEALQAQVNKTIQEKLLSMDRESEKELEQRNTDPNYQNLLLSNLKILPLIKDEAAYGELKKRLSIFQDDPVAIAAIRTALSSNTGTNKLLYTSCIPEDTRTSKKERLVKLENTVCGLLDEMKIKINNRVFEQGDSVSERDVSKVPIISATLDYMAACNDDCTVYDINKHLYSE